jgi:ABC-type multidrug transport system fused ATPase/permease subunit
MADPFTAPDPAHLRTPIRYLWWLVTNQKRRVAAGATLGTGWMIGLAVPPYLMSRAIDDGLQRKDTAALVEWVAVMLGLGMANAVVGVMRHRTMTRIRLDAQYRTVRAVVRRTTELGATLPRLVTAGEVVTIGMSDVQTIALSLTLTGPGFGAAIAYIAVAVVLFSISPLLAVVVLAGVPLLAVSLGPLLRRLQRAGAGYREEQGALTARLVDIVGGLRILGGLGGKDVYAARYRHGSQALRTKGYRVGAVTSWVDAIGPGLPALFLAVVTWLAARMAAEGAITVGDLVAVYGYVAVLVVPVFFFIEGGSDLTRAVVSAARVIAFLNLSPPDQSGIDAPATPAVLHDPASDVRVEPGRLIALASARSADAVAVVQRLGRFADSDATWGGIRLDRIARSQIRDRILIADNEADIFAGSVTDVVAGRHAPRRDAIDRAIYTAAAQDVVDALPDGLDSTIAAQGRSLSGGQRQRIRLARAVYAEPEVLLAVEPTSAVDAHTEAAMAQRLRAARAGSTTVVTATSPLVLEYADVVYYLVDGRAAACGTHHELLDREPGYRALVSR